MELNERIALARKRAGLSQEELGDKLGVSRQAVSKWESGQTNPDVAYVAEMCRLLGVSSDWLLLGEESAQEAAPARCPKCQAVVTGLDNFCPKCGQPLRGMAPDGYTLVLDPQATILTPDRQKYLSRDLYDLSAEKWFGGDSPLASPIELKTAQALVDSAPVVLARGVSAETADLVLRQVHYQDSWKFYKDPAGLSAQELLEQKTPVPRSSLAPPERPLSFGMVVLAVILGVIGALVLLSFL